jgi:hypothetical protein
MKGKRETVFAIEKDSAGYRISGRIPRKGISIFWAAICGVGGAGMGGTYLWHHRATSAKEPKAEPRQDKQSDVKVHHELNVIDNAPHD